VSVSKYLNVVISQLNVYGDGLVKFAQGVHIQLKCEILQEGLAHVNLIEPTLEILLISFVLNT
jgi:hypothetical protein